MARPTRCRPSLFLGTRGIHQQERYQFLKITLERLAALVPHEILLRSGAVFYSGRAAFESNSPVYLLGINPGGDPIAQADETVAGHIEKVTRLAPANWSEYRDESWLGRLPGTHGMQPRVLHMMTMLSIDPGLVPSSNLVFARSRAEDTFDGNMRHLAEKCWPLHEAVIDNSIQAVICFGSTCGDFVRGKLTAEQEVDRYIETNRRGWSSRCHQAPDGRKVLTLTHPGRTGWQNPNADPTPLVKRALSWN